MKNKNMIYLVLGVLGTLMIVGGLFLPFTNGYTFAGEKIIATLFNTFGIYIIILIGISIILGILKLYRFILLPIVAILGLTGFELYKEMTMAYDPASDYQQMDPGIGFFLIIVGSILIAIYAIITKKEDKEMAIETEKEPTEEMVPNTIAPLPVEENPLFSYQAPRIEDTYDLPPEIEGDEIPVEENTIQIPIITENDQTDLTPNINSNKQYEEQFDIVKATAEELNKEERQEINTKEVSTTDTWNIDTIGDTFTDLPLYDLQTSKVEPKTTDQPEEETMVVNIDQLLNPKA